MIKKRESKQKYTLNVLFHTIFKYPTNSSSLFEFKYIYFSRQKYKNIWIYLS